MSIEALKEAMARLKNLQRPAPPLIVNTRCHQCGKDSETLLRCHGLLWCVKCWHKI